MGLNRMSTELKSLVTVTRAHASFPGSGTASAILRRPTLIPRNCTDNKRISENWDVAGAKKFDGDLRRELKIPYRIDD
ncbi:hypothetical protein WN51_12080 [Melipona quadrifasciata]|uniref:Uncharacterized protein n=1 Tax=Melipona quadrifasciata TaxID=166423 RepID=A0A0M9A4G9_9HYME|nr:hypothetical protein WN51_12080 [Melipona quadrifasciata]